MKEKSLHNKSKYLSYLLRHNPEKENLKLDSQGYTEVKDILKIDALKMLEDGFEFFISENNVIQIDKVPKYFI